MNERIKSEQSPTLKQKVEARVGLLHSLGREAVDVWDAVGNPIPVPPFTEMKSQLLEIGSSAVNDAVVPHAAVLARIPLPIQRMPGNGSFA